MIIITCKKCGKKFKTFPCRIIINNPRKYCSKECRKTSIIKKCLICGKEFKAFQRSIKAGGGKYCSLKCFGISERGKTISEKMRKAISKAHKNKKHPAEHKKKNSLAKMRGNNPNWKDGSSINKRYKEIFMPDHPLADSNHRIKKHRLVMEKHLKRYLLPTEVVHHINGVRNDNRIKNLRLFPSQGEHFRFHRLNPCVHS